MSKTKRNQTVRRNKQNKFKGFFTLSVRVAAFGITQMHWVAEQIVVNNYLKVKFISHTDRNCSVFCYRI